MKNLKTISNNELRISSNSSKRTFTIRTGSSKYRTLPFSRQEFEHADRFWTGNDWQQFLRTDEYYKVK
jgi:hypothetical protein